MGPVGGWNSTARVNAAIESVSPGGGELTALFPAEAAANKQGMNLADFLLEAILTHVDRLGAAAADHEAEHEDDLVGALEECRARLAALENRLAAALDAQGKSAEAAEVRAEIAEAWSEADIELAGSRL